MISSDLHQIDLLSAMSINMRRPVSPSDKIYLLCRPLCPSFQTPQWRSSHNGDEPIMMIAEWEADRYKNFPPSLDLVRDDLLIRSPMRQKMLLDWRYVDLNLIQFSS